MLIRIRISVAFISDKHTSFQGLFKRVKWVKVSLLRQNWLRLSRFMFDLGIVLIPERFTRPFSQCPFALLLVIHFLQPHRFTDYWFYNTTLGTIHSHVLIPLFLFSLNLSQKIYLKFDKESYTRVLLSPSLQSSVSFLAFVMFDGDGTQNFYSSPCLSMPAADLNYL